MRTRFLFGISLVFMLLMGCDSNSDEPFNIDNYLGTYEGTASQRLELPDGTVTTQMSNGSVMFASNAVGQVTITAAADTPGQAPLTADGTYDDTGMRFRTTQANNRFLEIVFDEDGDASGGGTFDFFNVLLDADVDGKITPRRIDLNLTFNVIEGNDQVPAGSVQTLQYSATR